MQQYAAPWRAPRIFVIVFNFGFSRHPAKISVMKPPVRWSMLRLALALMMPLVLAGCLIPDEESAPPVTSAQLASIRRQFRATDASARVGVVTAVLPSSHLASVGSVPVKDFTPGDVMTFLDSNQKVLTMGHVETVEPRSLIVRYDPPGSSGRAPVAGDLAVRAIH
jgi:hypothetical protein